MNRPTDDGELSNLHVASPSATGTASANPDVKKSWFFREDGRFVISTIVLPVIVMTFGALLTAHLQRQSHAWESIHDADLQQRAHEWEARHDGALKTQERLQDAAIGFSQELQTLVDEIAIWETTSGNRELAPFFSPIQSRLETIRGLVARLEWNFKWDVSMISTAVVSCESELRRLDECIGGVLRERPLNDARCAPKFLTDVCRKVTTITFLISDKRTGTPILTR